MKRLLLLIAILMVPAALFAQVQVGATALYNFPYSAGTGPAEIDPSDFTFGADARMKILVFQASGLALFTPGYDDAGATVPGRVDLHVDGGIAIDVLMLRLGLGVGPSIQFLLAPDADPVRAGVNVKATADIMLGDFSVGLTYLNQFGFNLADGATQLLDQDYTQGLLGVSVLFQL
jgi:hypothetical protein